jgi:PAS domain S-box-containing protein
MTEIVRINLENEMDLILVHKRTMKLAELCGMTLISQTTFATAVSEVARCVIGKEKKSLITLNIENLKSSKKSIIVSIASSDKVGPELKSAIQYASRLMSDISVNETKSGSQVDLTLPIGFSGLINPAKVESFITYFKTELPLSPYDEIRKKNILLLEFAEKLKGSESQYKSLTETLPLMIFTTSPSGHVVFANKWLKDWVSAPELLSGKFHWHKLIHTNNLSKIREEWDKAVSVSDSLRSQARIASKNAGEDPLWHMISMLPVRNEQGHVISWTGFFADIHAQKLVEETLKDNSELKKAQRQLLNSQAKLEEKLKELNKSNHDLEQFAYIASHDLQEPLRKIRSFTELVERNIDSAPKAKKYIDKIDDSAKRMSNLIQGVLNYSRLSTGERTFADVDMNEVIRNVMVDVELSLEERKARIEMKDLPVIIGLKAQLQQLFYNLVSNSLKFCETDPVISISSKNFDAREIKDHPELHSSVNYVQITFKDNGIGFDQKYARQIFTIFSRLHSRQSYEGTGIGLALCKKIVDNHHGVISAFSNPGQGAEFRIILPVS